MALPHIMSSYKYYPTNYHENIIVEKRNREQAFRDFWSNSSSYFAQSSVTADQKKSWESKSSFLKSLESYENLKTKDDSKEKLKVRKEKLKDLLATEEQQYQNEIKEAKNSRCSLSYLRQQLEAKKLATIEQDKLLANEKLFELWRQNNERLRQSTQHHNYMVFDWSKQLLQLKQKENEEEMSRRVDDNYEEMERQKQEEDRQRHLEKLENIHRRKKLLQEQMDGIRQVEHKAKLLKLEEDELRRQELQLEDIQRKQYLVQETRNDENKKYAKSRLHQHAATLRRKGHQVQKNLMEDTELLRWLVAEEEREQMMEKEENVSYTDAQYMLQVFFNQMKLEKAREAELDLLYKNEAAKLWDRREEEWNREKLARETILQQVIEERKLQVEENMLRIRNEQKASILLREEMLQNLQKLNRELKEMESMENNASNFDEEQLGSQDIQEEVADGVAGWEEEEESALREMQNMQLSGYKPKHYGRKKQAWT